eukprot:6010183-Pleurochrysis_carterae.AAC.1
MRCSIGPRSMWRLALRDHQHLSLMPVQFDRALASWLAMETPRPLGRFRQSRIEIARIVGGLGKMV